MIVINFIGQPGAGKTTAAAGLFYALKRRHLNVEIVTEFTKDVIFENNHFILSDELLIFSEKYKRIKRLDGQVDFVITDSPLINSVVYAENYSQTGKDFFLELSGSFDNIYCFIQKGSHCYQTIGRLQSEQAASVYEQRFMDIIKEHGLEYFTINSDDADPDGIIKNGVLQKKIQQRAPLFGNILDT